MPILQEVSVVFLYMSIAKAELTTVDTVGYAHTYTYV